jgi:hypothetical protein
MKAINPTRCKWQVDFAPLKHRRYYRCLKRTDAQVGGAFALLQPFLRRLTQTPGSCSLGTKQKKTGRDNFYIKKTHFNFLLQTGLKHFPFSALINTSQVCSAWYCHSTTVSFKEGGIEYCWSSPGLNKCVCVSICITGGTTQWIGNLRVGRYCFFTVNKSNITKEKTCFLICPKE